MTPATEMLTALFEGAPKDSWIDLRRIRSDGPAIEHFIATSEVAAAVEWATARRETGNIYVGVLPRARRDGGRDAVAQAQVVWADCDSPEAVAALREFDLRPSMTVASGSPGNLHAYWLLTEPAELDRVELINRRLAAVLGSDPHVHDAARILRVPGTLNHKQDPPAEVVLLDCNEARYTVARLEGALPEIDASPTASPTPTGKGVATPEATPTQRLLVRLGAVRETGNGWMARCPAHEDETPSLSVTEEEGGLCLLHCFAGCTPEDVVTALQLDMTDLFPEPSGGSASLATRLVRLALDAGVELVHDEQRIAYATIDRDGHRETLPVKSPEFAEWLQHRYYSMHRRVPAANATADASGTLAGMARFDGPQAEVAVRLAGTLDRITLDLGDERWRTVTTTAVGWSVDDTPAARFRRPATLGALPTPQSGA